MADVPPGREASLSLRLDQSCGQKTLAELNLQHGHQLYWWETPQKQKQKKKQKQQSKRKTVDAKKASSTKKTRNGEKDSPQKEDKVKSKNKKARVEPVAALGTGLSGIVLDYVHMAASASGAGAISSSMQFQGAHRLSAVQKGQVQVVVTQETATEGQPCPESEVRRQLQDWFGAQAQEWQHIHTYTINAAQPRQAVPFPSPYVFRSHLQNGIFACGDFCTTGTIDGALFSGRRAAQEIRDWLQR